MFCDLVGSTALSEKLDPEELGSLLHAIELSAATRSPATTVSSPAMSVMAS